LSCQVSFKIFGTYKILLDNFLKNIKAIKLKSIEFLTEILLIDFRFDQYLTY